MAIANAAVGWERNVRIVDELLNSIRVKYIAQFGGKSFANISTESLLAAANGVLPDELEKQFEMRFEGIAEDVTAENVKSASQKAASQLSNLPYFLSSDKHEDDCYVALHNEGGLQSLCPARSADLDCLDFAMIPRRPPSPGQYVKVNMKSNEFEQGRMLYIKDLDTRVKGGRAWDGVADDGVDMSYMFDENGYLKYSPVAGRVNAWIVVEDVDGKRYWSAAQNLGTVVLLTLPCLFKFSTVEHIDGNWKNNNIKNLIFVLKSVNSGLMHIRLNKKIKK